MINVGVRKRYNIGISGFLRALCVIIAVIILLPFLSFLGAINLTPIYSFGTFEEFYDQVGELYAKFGDVQEERVVISKNDAIEIGGEVFVEASSLNEDMINGVVEIDSASIAENGVCADEISAQDENTSSNNTSENGEATSAVSTTNEVLSGDVARSGVVCEASNVGVESDLANAIEVSKKAESTENRAFVNLNDTKYIVTETAENYILSNLYTNRIIVYYEGELEPYKTKDYAEGLGWHIYQYSSSSATDEAFSYYSNLSYVESVAYDSVYYSESYTQNVAESVSLGNSAENSVGNSADCSSLNSSNDTEKINDTAKNLTNTANLSSNSLATAQNMVDTKTSNTAEDSAKNLSAENINLTDNLTKTSANSTERELENDDVSANTTRTFLSWGAKYTGVGEYLSYLTRNYDESELETVYVPILDSGVNTRHELLTGRYSSTYGRNFVGVTSSNKDNITTDIEDDEGHGSHTAGIIVDQTLSNVILIPCKVLKSTGTGSIAMIVTAIEYIISLKNSGLDIRVLNMSLGVESKDGSPVTGVLSLEKAMEKSYASNIMAVVSAGNSESQTWSNAPANMDKEVITVSALDENPFAEGGVSFADSYSNYGSTVDLSAPGSYIKSSYKVGGDNNDGIINHYKELPGTSMAAPHVTASIANLLSNPLYASMSNEEIQNLLFENAIDLGDEGKDIYYGYGCVNIANIGVETLGEVTFSVEEGEKEEPITLELSYDYDGDYTIYYTLDETLPNEESNEYLSPIEISKTTKVTAVAYVYADDGNIIAKSKITAKIYYFDHIDLESCYVVSGNGYSGALVSYSGSLTTLSVPNEISGVAITSVQNSAFAESKVENVTFGSSCLQICDYAFYGLSSLKSVKGEGVRIVGSYAFADCVNLETVMLENAYTIGNYALKGCQKLTDLDLSYATTIKEGALDDLALNSLTLGANLTTFEDSYFKAKTIYAYSSSNFEERLKDYADEYVNLDMRFLERYPTRVVYKSSGEATVEFHFYAPKFDLDNCLYRLEQSNLFDYPTVTKEVESIIENVGEDEYRITFTFKDLPVDSYSFQLYIYDEFGKTLSTDVISVVVLTGGKEEYVLSVNDGEFDVYIDNMKAENGFKLYGDLTYEIVVEPKASYYISSVTANGESVEITNGSFTISGISENLSIDASVLPIEEFDISFSLAEGATALCDGEVLGETVIVKRNNSFTFSVDVEDAYFVTYVEIDGIRQTLQNTYTIENVLSDHTVSIGTQKKSFVVTINYGAGGVTSGQSSKRVDYGESVIVPIEAQEGYEVKAVYVNGKKVESENGSVALSSITCDTEIFVQFEKEGEGLFEGIRLILFVMMCLALFAMVVSIIILSLKKSKKKQKIG